MKRFVDMRTGQVVKAEPKYFADGLNLEGFLLTYPSGRRVTMSREIFGTYYRPLYDNPNQQGAA